MPDPPATTVPDPPVAMNVSLPSVDSMDSPASPEPSTVAEVAVTTTSLYPGDMIDNPSCVWTYSPNFPGFSAGGI